MVPLLIWPENLHSVWGYAGLMGQDIQQLVATIWAPWFSFMCLSSSSGLDQFPRRQCSSVQALLQPLVVSCVPLFHWPKQITTPSSESLGEGDALDMCKGWRDALAHYSNNLLQFSLCHKWVTSLPHAKYPHPSQGPGVSFIMTLGPKCRVS